MSFINLMANDVWSDTDITRRTEAMIRSDFSLDAETILNRKVLGISVGTYVPSTEDQLEIAKYTFVAQAAQAEGTDARIDMALLNEALKVEAAVRRLALEPIEVIVVESEQEEPQAVVETDDELERKEAQAVIDAASEDVKALVEVRYNFNFVEVPIIEPLPDIVEETDQEVEDTSITP